MNMEHYENRFGFYREKSTEELEQIILELEEELQDWTDILEDENSISEQKTDAHTEIKFINDQLFYLDMIMKERKGPIR